MPATHYLYEGSPLCSHASEEADRSDSILDVSCMHCWDKYDDLEDRTVNICEMRYSAGHMRHHLKMAARIYSSDEEFWGESEPIAAYGFWFLEGPDSVPDELIRDERNLQALEAGHGIVRSNFMKSPRDSLTGIAMSSRKYRKNVDRLLRALRPVLTDDDAPKSRLGANDLRNEILQREGDRCDICDATLDESDSKSPAVDHIIPEALGGPSEDWNLRILCQTCNEFKHVIIDPAGVEKAADRLENRIAD